MIDERINKSLQELENQLKEVESAREQVEQTINSYDGLNKATSEYVSSMNILTNKIKELIFSVETDYKQKVSSFEKDRKTIVDSVNAASQKLSDATDSFQNSLNNLKTKLKYSFILNGVILVALAAILFMIVK